MRRPVRDPVPGDMVRSFDSREELVAYLRVEFPMASAESDAISPTRGGRTAAEARLQAMHPGDIYKQTRNYLDGAVTHLSPYLRHGVVSLAEAADAARGSAETPHDVAKFLNELAWRDYYQRVYAERGNAIWDDIEPNKTGISAEMVCDTLPDDIPAAETGLACIDAFAQELHQTGYLHNHSRMWLAAYVVHWRRVRWQAGARWFLTHLLDGDPASNNLSWQWVASTFSHKPYIFNRNNLERFSHGRYCHDCPLRDGGCPFDESYETLSEALFPDCEETP